MAPADLDAPTYGRRLREPRISLRSIRGSRLRHPPYVDASHRLIFGRLPWIGKKDKLQDDGMHTFMTLVWDEVTSQMRELEAANRSLEEANQKVLLQSQNQLKHFAMMSHEIWMPLNYRAGVSNLLLDDSNLEVEVQESLKMITSSGDLFMWSHLWCPRISLACAAGKVETIIQPTNVRKTINATTELLKNKWNYRWSWKQQRRTVVCVLAIRIFLCDSCQ
jgi:signal transduction histidine kinase